MLTAGARGPSSITRSRGAARCCRLDLLLPLRHTANLRATPKNAEAVDQPSAAQCASYALASIRSPDFAVTRTFTIHAFCHGSAVSQSRLSGNALLTSITSPDTGE